MFWVETEVEKDKNENKLESSCRVPARDDDDLNKGKSQKHKILELKKTLIASQLNFLYIKISSKRGVNLFKASWPVPETI